MYRRMLSHSLMGLGLAMSIGACTSPDLSQPCPIPPDVLDTLNNTTDMNSAAYKQASAAYAAALNKCFPAMSDNVVDPKLKKDVDILFLIDNSTSMSPKQTQLATQIGQFIQKIDSLPINYHVGVVTSDIGTLPSASMFPGANDPRCGTQKGDDGLFQNTPCTNRTANVSPEFTNACRGNAAMGITALCPDPTFVPKDRWISKENGLTNVPVKMVNGQDVGPIEAFKCIGLVGDGGCGVEGQLEAVRRALDGHLTENNGFLRSNSLLTVIFITDEDDCSVQQSQRMNLNPASMSCPTSGVPDPNYGCYNLDYRCIAKDLECNEPLDVPGPKTGCHERADTWLEPLDKYVRFFTGLRDADHLILAGIWSPSTLDFDQGKMTTYGNGQLQVATTVTGDNSTQLLNRAEKTMAACFNSDTKLTTDPKGYFGQAQLRLSLFKSKFDKGIWAEQSICDVNNYKTVLDNIANNIDARSKDCTSVLPYYDSNKQATCLVGFVDANQPDALPDVYLPQCSAGCCDGWASSALPIGNYGPGGTPAKDPKIVSACTAETKDCFCAVQSHATPAPICVGGAVAGVWRVGDAAPPAGKVVNFRCAGTRPANPVE